MSQKLAISLVVIGIVGLCAIAIFRTLNDRQLRPFRSDLPVAAERFTSPLVTLEPGYRYRVAVGGDGSVPSAGCLLGASNDPRSGDCKRHPSALSVAWSLRDDRGRVVASGASPGNQWTFEFGKYVEADLGYLSVFRATAVGLTLQYRRNSGPLFPLHLYIVIDAPDALAVLGVSETLAGLLFVTLACVGGGKLFVSRWRRRD